jgi:NTP pyrophosphatase (non-canonical NTP hydrolase)
MKKREEMLVITMEECGELIQACSKMIRFDEPCDTKQLQEEIGDVMCMIEILRDGGLVSDKQIADRIKVKKEKLMKWSLLFSED